MNRLFYLCILLFVQNEFAQAQKAPTCHFSIEGKVLDFTTGEPVPDANVYLTEYRLHTTCDERGSFHFEQVCAGTYTLVFFNIGNIELKTVVVVNAKKTPITVSLQKDTAQSFELVVTGIKKDSIVEQGIASSLKGAQLDAAKMVSLGEGLKSLPGVYAQQSGANTFKPVVQGLSGNRVTIYNNGVRQEGQQWGSDHAPEIDPMVADEIKVIKGAGTVRYGSDIIGGVILVNPAPLLDHGLKSEWFVAGNSVNKSGTVSGKIDWAPHRIKGLSTRIQGSLKRGGNYKTPNYYLDNTGISEYYFSWALRKALKRFYAEVYYSQFNTETGIFSGSHIGNVTDLENAIQSDVPLAPNYFTYDIARPYQHVEHELAKVELGVLLNRKQKLTWDITRQYNYRAEYDKHKAYNSNGDAPQLQFKITTYTSTLNWRHRFNSRLSGDIGINGMTQENTVAGRVFIPNFINQMIGAYWSEQIALGKWVWEAGLRYDVRNLNAYFYKNNVLENPAFQYQNYAASLGATLAIKEYSTWNFLFSRAFRSPAVNELFSQGLHHGVAAIETGNINLSPEKAYNLLTGYKIAKSKFSGEFNAYVNYIEDFIYLRPLADPVLTIHGAFPAFEFTQTNALLYGGDVMVAYQLHKHINVGCKLSMLSARDLVLNEYLINMPPTRIEPSISYQFKNTTRFKDPTFILSSTIVFKKENVPADIDYLPPPNGYALLNAQAFTKIKVGREWWTAGIKGTNLFNTVYRDYLDRFRYYHDAQGVSIQVFLKVPITLKP